MNTPIGTNQYKNDEYHNMLRARDNRRSVSPNKRHVADASDPFKASNFPILDDDNLEYFIKFPSSNFMDNKPDSDYLLVYNEKNIPIILLLGWAGCKDKYLQKYSAFYEERGLITVRYIAPLDALFWKRCEMNLIGDKILKLIYDMNFDTHPIIIHAFSNGGAYLYQHISIALRKYQRPIRIRGIIYDSAPGERRTLGLYRAISTIYAHENRRFNFISAWAATLTLTFMWFIEETFVAFKRLFVRTPSKINLFKDLKQELSDWPQLLLYSKSDNVIPYQDIENFADYRKKMGVNVRTVCFEDAEHVKLFSKYPQQYVDCCLKFVNECLSHQGTMKNN